MSYSRFTSAQLDGSGHVTVDGPIFFAEQEQNETVVSPINFVLVQGDVFVRGTGISRGEGTWGGTADAADELQAGVVAQGYGVALLVRRPQDAIPATANAPATPKAPPLVQVLAWSEAVEITD